MAQKAPLPMRLVEVSPGLYEVQVVREPLPAWRDPGKNLPRTQPTDVFRPKPKRGVG